MSEIVKNILWIFISIMICIVVLLGPRVYILNQRQLEAQKNLPNNIQVKFSIFEDSIEVLENNKVISFKYCNSVCNTLDATNLANDTLLIRSK